MDKKSIIIVILLFFIILSAGALYLLFDKNRKIETKLESYKNVIVANKNLDIGHKISKEDLLVIELQQKSIPFRILVESEIVGKFTTTAIYQNEPFREEKIASASAFLEQKEDVIKLEFIPEYDIFNMQITQFRNPNYLLNKNDKIDIIAVLESQNGLEIEIIAQNVKILGFLRDGISQDGALVTIEPKATPKEPNPMPKDIFANEFLLDLDESRVKKIVEASNKGNQFWMIWDHNSKKELLKKISKEETKKLEEEELKESSIDENISKKPLKSAPKVATIPAYKNVIEKIESKITISYENSSNIDLFKDYRFNNSSRCTNLLEIIVSSANIRKKGDSSSKILYRAKRGDVISFSSIERDYYILCDGLYLHKSVAREIR